MNEKAERMLQEWITEANKRSSTYSPWDVRDRLLEIYSVITAPKLEPVA